MNNPIIDVADLLRDDPDLNRAPKGSALIPRTHPGVGFFPGFSGRFAAAGQSYPFNESAPSLLLVGQDFGTDKYLKEILIKGGEQWPESFPYLNSRWLGLAGIPPEECFFTNALMCISGRRIQDR